MRILLTGGSGFVGRALIESLAGSGYEVIALVTRAVDLSPAHTSLFPGLSFQFDLRKVFVGITSVIHCAARVHVMDENSNKARAEFRKVNVDGTLNLARQAAAAGVKRFIFISSIKVNGESTNPGQQFRWHDIPAPADPYGESKLEAEQGLLALAQETGMEVVIIRPPLIYGPGVKGNFSSFIKLVDKGLPLPLGAIHNKRSLVSIDNLTNLIMLCVDHPLAVNRVFLVSDGEDLSTTELLLAVGKAMGRPVWLIPLPAFFLRIGASALGKRAVANRLLGSLQVDITQTCEVLGWKPPLSVEEGLKRCFLSRG